MATECFQLPMFPTSTTLTQLYTSTQPISWFPSCCLVPRRSVFWQNCLNMCPSCKVSPPFTLHVMSAVGLWALSTNPPPLLCFRTLRLGVLLPWRRLKGRKEKEFTPFCFTFSWCQHHPRTGSSLWTQQGVSEPAISSSWQFWVILRTAWIYLSKKTAPAGSIPPPRCRSQFHRTHPANF